ncbi:lipopolysaccharide transport system permease protein [Tistlia consotensis]|uniref:Lipopolysaccharide transport system permease protein n=1 Tax=Tistlia consotensis USBA 355 TaxID=560819 RepID=A0A1Y6CLN3_9PROT|nr:ABC transporter permease [Tistlia consotensis]SMF71781.1 lipopolysaccharide transport system permease protein [Tistlia consotensis USBA 355]SNS06296.1 lipopolysaccharide transport system permease protein [Tistlia consotensis]
MSALIEGDRTHSRGRDGAVFHLAADSGWPQRFGLMARDLRDGASLWRLAWLLATSDIRLRYRGSVLGPLWLTLSTAVMIGAMGFIYAALFRADIRQYLPYLSVSIVIWNYLSALVNEGCNCFLTEQKLIHGARMPFSLHAARSVLRNTIVFAHNVVVIVPVFLLVGAPVTWEILWVVPALLLWLLDGFAVAMLLGALCARFRDVPPIVGALLQVVFFATPIMWYASLLDGHPLLGVLIRFNPFFHLLEVVRAPLLGGAPPAGSVLGALAASAVALALAAVGFARMRGRIAYWV